MTWSCVVCMAMVSVVRVAGVLMNVVGTSLARGNSVVFEGDAGLACDRGAGVAFDVGRMALTCDVGVMGLAWTSDASLAVRIDVVAHVECL